MQISEECNLRYNDLLCMVQREKIVPAERKNKRIFFDKYQEDYIHNILYFSGKITEINLQSKINTL